MNVNIDPDTTPDTYIEHREFVRIPDGVAAPTQIRIGSSTGASKEAARGDVARRRPAADELDVPDRLHVAATWTRPRSRQRFLELAAEFPNIATIVPLPYKTNGYSRRAQATLNYVTTSLSVASAAGASAIRVASTTGLVAGNDITVDTGAARSGARSRRS